MAPQVPWPLDVGSKIRIYNLLISYAQLGPVTLVCFSQDPADLLAVSNLDSIVESIHCIALTEDEPRMSAGKLGALARALLPNPKIVRHFRRAGMEKKIKMLMENDDFDILHVERLFMVENVRGLLPRASIGRNLLTVLDMDDIESSKALRLQGSQSWRSPRKLLLLLEYLKLWSYERRILPLFDLALVCSRADQHQVAARRRPHRAPAIEVFCNGADIDGPQGADGDSRTLLFFGALNYQPNEDAALHFASVIFPLVKRSVADARFVIAGKAPSNALYALHNGRDVVVSGYVNDKRTLFASATVIVVPIRVGGGTRIKILEAMAAGKPVVSTTVGCEGIEVTPRVDILVADSPQEFADACIELLRSEAKGRSIGEAGRRLVAQKYRWQQIREGFASSISARLGDRGEFGATNPEMPSGAGPLERS